MLRRSWGPMFVKSSPLQKGVERVEALEAAAQNFFIGQSLFSPSLEDAIDPYRFRPLKFFVLEVRVVNHLRDFPHCFVANRETIGERFECAIIANVREFCIHHVERNRFRMRWDFAGKNETRFRIYELPNEPG